MRKILARPFNSLCFSLWPPAPAWPAAFVWPDSRPLARSARRPGRWGARLAAALATSLVLGLAACGDDGGDTPAESLQITLTGDQEAPVPVASVALGSAALSLDRATRTLAGSITVDGTAPTAAHLHAGEAGSAGAVVFALTVSGQTATLAPTVLTEEQLATLDAGGFYLNVHSAAYPDGEIRGQIGREVFVAHLTGSQETAGVDSAATGDGRLVLDPATGAVTGELVLTGLEATAAHVHNAAFGGDGPILVTLEAHGEHGHFVIPTGTVLAPEDADKLRAGGLYLNAHSAEHPSGEVRGQLGRRIFLAQADGAHEVPSTPSSATGRGFVAYDPTTRAIEGRLSLDGLDATAAHIHQAEAGSNGAIIVPLTQAGAGSPDWTVATGTPPLTLEQAQALQAGGLYYNAHSAAYASGEIRGQLQLAADAAAPLLHIVSPAAGATLARGEGRVGAGSFNGTGFSINLEMITRDAVGLVAQESLNIRDTSLLGQANPHLPTLVVSFDADLIKPDGTLIPKGTNLASLFNIAGSDDTGGPGITLWTGWHVLESFPEDVDSVTISASVTDQAGRVASDRIVYPIGAGHASAQSLTPQTAGLPGDGVDDPEGPVVTMIAPRPDSAVATGPQQDLPTPPANASLLFIQVSALDVAGAGIAVNENGEGKADADRGTILDGAQIAAQGPNRYFPGLYFSLDVPLRQPNGNVVPPGQNLAPLFNIVGSEQASSSVRTTAGWVIGGSLLMPAGQTTVTALARVTDNAGHSGSTTGSFGVSATTNGQALTPSP